MYYCARRFTLAFVVITQTHSTIYYYPQSIITPILCLANCPFAKNLLKTCNRNWFFFLVEIWSSYTEVFVYFVSSIFILIPHPPWCNNFLDVKTLKRSARSGSLSFKTFSNDATCLLMCIMRIMQECESLLFCQLPQSPARFTNYQYPPRCPVLHSFYQDFLDSFQTA